MAVADRTRADHRLSGAVLGVVVSTALAGCGSAPGPVTLTPAPAAPDASRAPVGEDNPGPAEDAAWWRLTAQGVMGPAQAIDVGTLGDTGIRTIEVPMQVVDPNALVFPMRSVIGPRNGLVVTIGGDGGEAVLMSIDAASGEERELARTTEVVVDAVFATGTSVVFMTASPRTGAFTGVWRLDAAAPPAQPEPVEGLIAAGDFQLAARSVGSSRLFASPGGDLVALRQCSAAGACVIRAVNVVDGTRYEQPLRAGDEPVGLAGERVLLRPICEAACAAELLDLASGERAPMPATGNPMFLDETVIATESGAMLVTQVSGHTMPMPGPAPMPAFVLTSLDDGRTGDPIMVELESMRVVSAGSYELGIELPPGWFAVMGSAEAAAGAGGMPLNVFAVSAANGEVVPLPALGEFLIQG